MDELESRLDHQLSGLGRVPLAEPVPVEDLRRRARHVRAGRMLTSVAATATAVVLIVGVIAVTRKNPEEKTVQVAAPDIVLGDIDAVVLSSSLDADGARTPLPASLAATVAAVPGVQIVSGVVDTFATVLTEQQGGGSYPLLVQGRPPRTPILFTYHEGDQIHVTGGRSPAAANEVIVDADVLSRYDVGIGSEISVRVREQDVAFTIVGTFDLPGVDLTGMPLAAMSASYQPQDILVDRLDVKFKPGANFAKVRDAIAIAVGNYTVSAPSVISFPDQRLAQLEIQHAYWALLSPDDKERSGSGVGATNDQEQANYDKYKDLATHVELRVENVAFLSPDAAALTFRIYYGGSPSPIIDKPQSGSATRVDGHWQLGTNTLCSLAALVGITCEGDAANVPVTPPTGYEPVSSLDPEVRRAFEALANPDATVDQRVAAVADGEAYRAVVTTGVAQDRQYSGKTKLTLAGWRQDDENRIGILFSLQTEGGPSTPWPSNALALRLADGHWYAAAQYACGIEGLAGGGCTQPSDVSGAREVIGTGDGGETATTSPVLKRP